MYTTTIESCASVDGKWPAQLRVLDHDLCKDNVKDSCPTHVCSLAFARLRTEIKCLDVSGVASTELRAIGDIGNP